MVKKDHDENMQSRHLLALVAFLIFAVVVHNILEIQKRVVLPASQQKEAVLSPVARPVVVASVANDDDSRAQPRLSFPPYTNESIVIVIKKGHGRFGNQLWQYASTFGTSQRAAAEAHFCMARVNAVKDVRQHLAGPFPPKCPPYLLKRLERQVEVGFGRYTNFTLSCNNNKEPPPCVWTFDSYLQSYKYFMAYSDLVRESFRPNPSLQEQVDGVFGKLPTTASTTLIGLHVRRGDVMSDETVHMNPVPLDYYSRAMAYMKNKYPTAHFLLASDDKDWCRNQTIFQSNNASSQLTILPASLEYAVEWAILAQKCHHMIMGVGTYGWWAAFMTAGDVIYYKEPLKLDHPRNKGKIDLQDMFPPSWVGLL